MKKHLSLICLLALLAACAKQDEPAPPVAGAPAAPAAPAPELEPMLSAELLARLQRPDSPVLGPAQAPVTVVEFLDPACEACRAFAPVVKQVQFLYPTEVRVVVRFADFHPGSDEAIRILFAAQAQGKFEAVLAALFEGQEEWASHHSPSTDEAWRIAGAAGLDLPSARKHAASAATTARLQAEAEDLTALQVSRTPTFYVNGKLLAVFGAEPFVRTVTSEVKAVTAPPPN